MSQPIDNYFENTTMMSPLLDPTPIHVGTFTSHHARTFSSEDVDAILYVFGSKASKAAPEKSDDPSIHQSLLHSSPAIIQDAVPVARQPGKVVSDVSLSYPDLAPSTAPSHQSLSRFDTWNDQFQDLLKFRSAHGHCCVPNYCVENPPLGHWVKRQRYQYSLMKKGEQSSMTEERITALEEAGFIWNAHDAAWEEKLSDLRAYRVVNGHCKVPSTCQENPELATWAKRQRREFKVLCRDLANGTERRSKRCMTVKRVLKLAKVGFVFDNQDSKGALDVLTSCLRKHRKYNKLIHQW